MTPYVTLGIDSGHLLTWLFVGPVVTLYLLGSVFTSWQTERSRADIYALLIYGVIISVFALRADDVRAIVRWLPDRNEYKAKLLSQPSSRDGYLKHVEWDGSGFAGVAVQLIYVVYDPTDSLSEAAKSRQHGKYSGLPCDVYRVRRLEKYWYSVDFYTDSSWDACSFQ